MKVSFIIPVYGHLDLTRACLESLRNTVPGSDYEIIIVDDGSDERCKAGLEELIDQRTYLIRNKDNRGYAYSNNLGAKTAKGEILFLLNNDLEFRKGWFSPMLKAFRRFPEIGAVGNVQLDAATGEMDHSGYFVDWDAELKHKRSANRFGPFKKAYSKFHLITGACFAIRRTLFLELGGFDERYQNGCEDIDLCLKIGQRKRRIYVANKSVIQHAVSSTRGEPNLDQERNFRLLQNTWGERIAQLAAYRWPNHYLERSIKQPRTILWKLLFDAASRWLRLRKGASNVGIHLARYYQAQNERHWNSILDNWTDEMIKTEERKKHANWYRDRFRYTGLLGDKSRSNGLWIREKAAFKIPRGLVVNSIGIRGFIHPADSDHNEESGDLGLKVCINQVEAKSFNPLGTSDFKIELDKPPVLASESLTIDIELLGVSKTNFYAFLGRKWEKSKWIPKLIRDKLQKYRAQRKNKRLMIQGLEINNETLLDFENSPTSPLVFDYVLKYGNVGINLVGWFKAQLGIGESVRLAARALQATNIESSFVPLKVNCLAAQGDTSFDHLLTDENPYLVNIFHIDAPQSADIDHHHGPDFRKGRRNIAYWAWELPEFPDNWIQYFSYFDEIWTPSDFVTRAIMMKSPIPVLTVPHCIAFDRPEDAVRSRFKLPEDKFLFLFAYDLNSYQERKNPRAAIRAFKQAFAGSSQDDVGLVIKTHSTERNKEDFKLLQEQLDGIENVYLIDQTLSREDVYRLMSVCDCYVSLHRSEGFGLTVAESMYLGKPVISTHWSATSEFLNTDCGLPVHCELIKLKHSWGPYQKGQRWAEPNIDHAAEQMLKIKNDPQLADELGKKAIEVIEERFSPKAIGNLYEQRLKTFAMWESTTPVR